MRETVGLRLLVRPAGLIRILGPGLVTGASDDDPSGIGTYSQAGSQFGFGVLWTALFTFPLMLAVQEMCGRIALQTGVGLGVSLRRKFPTWLVGICILALFVANTINVGADLGAVASGGRLLSQGSIPELWLVAPAAALIIALQFLVTYATLFKIFKWLTLTLFAYVVAGVLVRPDPGRVLAATLIPHLELKSSYIQALVAILGTTISPYLFFWQASSEVDEMKAAGERSESSRRGVTRMELRAARLDIAVGMFFSQLIMYFILLTSATALGGHRAVQTAAQAARALEPAAGPAAFVLFAVGLIGTGLLAIPILSASATYGVKEFMGWSGGLAVRFKYRPAFYSILALATVAGVAMNFLGIDPIRALFLTAIVNGVIAPPLLVLIILLGSDRAVMAGRASGPLSRALSWTAAALMSAAVLALPLTALGPGGG